MITNALTKDDAYTIAMNIAEEQYKLTIEEIYDNIKKSANDGKFHLRHRIKAKQVHTLTEYFKNKGYMCSNDFDTIKDANGRILYEEDGITPIKKYWIDIWWSIK